MNQDLYDRVKAIVDKLPQRRVIPDAVADKWIRDTILLEGERTIWHAHRAATIGGSEAGEFPLAAMGKSPAYNSLEDLWLDKMLLATPQRPNIYMRRGTAMEDLANLVYLKKTGHKSVLKSPEIQEAFNKPHREHPHVGGNPDEVVDAAGRRIITDFKVRNSLDAESGIPFVNGCQLHWYGMIHEGNLGSRPDVYGLAELDIPAGMIDDLMANPPSQEELEAIAEHIASVDRPGFGMLIRFFPHNEMLANNLTRLTQQFWDKYVMTGTPYKNPKPRKPDNLTTDDHEKLEDAQARLLTFKLAQKVAEEEAEKARQDVMAINRKYELTEWPFETPGISAGFNTKFNTQKAATALIGKGVDRSSLVRKADDANVETMMRTLKAHNLLDDVHFKAEWDTREIKKQMKLHELPVSDFEFQNFRIGITRKKEDEPIKVLLETQMKGHLSSFTVTGGPDTDNTLNFDEDDDDRPGLRLA